MNKDENLSLKLAILGVAIMMVTGFIQFIEINLADEREYLFNKQLANLHYNEIITQSNIIISKISEFKQETLLEYLVYDKPISYEELYVLLNRPEYNLTITSELLKNAVIEANRTKNEINDFGLNKQLIINRWETVKRVLVLVQIILILINVVYSTKLILNGRKKGKN